MQKLTKSGRFDEVIEYYYKCIAMAESIKDFRIDDPEIFEKAGYNDCYTFAYVRALCSDLSLAIGQMDENTKYNDERLVEMMLSQIESVKKFKQKVPLTPERIKSQIRNCLEHANYDILIDDTKQDSDGYIDLQDVYLHISNKEIEGNISVFDLIKLTYFYLELKNRFPPNILNVIVHGREQETMEDYITGMNYISFIGRKTTSPSNIDRVVDEFSAEYNIDGDRIKQLLESIRNNYGHNFFVIQNTEKERQTEFLRDYFQYVDFDSFKRELIDDNSEKHKEAYENFLSNVIEAVISDQISVGLGPSFMQMIYTKYKINSLKKSQKYDSRLDESVSSLLESSEIALPFETPMVYANMVLGLSNYCFGYVREMMMRDSRAGASSIPYMYRDIEYISGATSEFEDLIRPRNTMQSYINELDAINQRYTSVIGAIGNRITDNNRENSKKRNSRKKKRNREALKNEIEKRKVYSVFSNIIAQRMSKNNGDISPQMVSDVLHKYFESPYEKSRLIPFEKDVLDNFEQLRSEFQEGKLPISLFDPKTIALKEKIEKENETFADSSNLFRHLRNSISHGRYTIDYSKGLTTGDLGDIEYHFYDYDTILYGDKKAFEFNVNAKDLLKIIESFRKKVNEVQKKTIFENTLKTTLWNEGINYKEILKLKGKFFDDKKDFLEH